MWGYPTTLWLFVAVSVWYMTDAFITRAKVSFIALGFALLGIPFYFICARQTPNSGRARKSWLPNRLIDYPI